MSGGHDLFIIEFSIKKKETKSEKESKILHFIHGLKDVMIFKLIFKNPM